MLSEKSLRLDSYRCPACYHDTEDPRCRTISLSTRPGRRVLQEPRTHNELICPAVHGVSLQRSGAHRGHRHICSQRVKQNYGGAPTAVEEASTSATEDCTVKAQPQG
ncbi:unnamed protein product [Arctogadus glacialis]